MSTENAPRWEVGHTLTDPVNLGIISILLFSQFFFFLVMLMACQSLKSYFDIIYLPHNGNKQMATRRQSYNV